MNYRKIFIGAVALLMPLAASAADFGGYGMLGIRIAVQDIPKSMEFYKHLGMKAGRLYHPGQQEMTWETGSQGPNVVLMQMTPGGNSTLKPGTASFMMYVPSIATTVKDLKKAGYSDVPEPKPAAGPAQFLVVKDPDGNAIELIAPAPK